MVKGQWLRLLDIFPVEFPVRHCMKSCFFWISLGRYVFETSCAVSSQCRVFQKGVAQEILWIKPRKSVDFGLPAVNSYNPHPVVEGRSCSRKTKKNIVKSTVDFPFLLEYQNLEIGCISGFSWTLPYYHHHVVRNLLWNLLWKVKGLKPNKKLLK